MNLTKNGITISISDAEVMELVLDRLRGASEVPGTITYLEPGQAAHLSPWPPRIGEPWPAQGGIYAGIARGRDGTADYHLIVGPENDGSADWSASLAWAKGIAVDGHRDFTLPFRKEQALCFANVPELFKPKYYWSCEQHASSSGNAWGQYFNDGYQDDWLKYGDVMARAVRRLTI